MPVDSEIFTDMPVDDFETARAWYEIFAGRPPDRAPGPGEAAWRLSGTSWIAVVADDARAGTALLTMVVDDLERHVGFVAMRGIAPDSVETVPGVVRRATIHDPAGNTITLEQSLAAEAPSPG